MIGMYEYAGFGADTGGYNRGNQEKNSEYGSQPDGHAGPVEQEGKEDQTQNQSPHRSAIWQRLLGIIKLWFPREGALKHTSDMMPPYPEEEDTESYKSAEGLLIQIGKAG